MFQIGDIVTRANRHHTPNVPVGTHAEVVEAECYGNAYRVKLLEGNLRGQMMWWVTKNIEGNHKIIWEV
jgi:hypothetical protein